VVKYLKSRLKSISLKLKPISNAIAAIIGALDTTTLKSVKENNAISVAPVRSITRRILLPLI
jgi:hypothetical protein